MTDKYTDIKIACESAAFLDLDQMTEFQGELKTLSKKNYKRLKKEILETGLGFPFRIWRNDGKFYIIGGHQTKRTLVEMRDKEGYHVPRLPVTWVHAKDYKEAKRRVLQDVAQYGKVERQGLYEFVTDAEIDIQELLDGFDIPEVELDVFKDEFFTDSNQAAEPDPEKEPDKLDEKHLIYITCPNCSQIFERGQGKPDNNNQNN